MIELLKKTWCKQKKHDQKTWLGKFLTVWKSWKWRFSEMMKTNLAELSRLFPTDRDDGRGVFRKEKWEFSKAESISFKAEEKVFWKLRKLFSMIVIFLSVYFDFRRFSCFPQKTWCFYAKYHVIFFCLQFSLSLIFVGVFSAVFVRNHGGLFSQYFRQRFSDLLVDCPICTYMRSFLIDLKFSYANINSVWIRKGRRFERLILKHMIRTSYIKLI